MFASLLREQFSFFHLHSDSLQNTLESSFYYFLYKLRSLVLFTAFVWGFHPLCRAVMRKSKKTLIFAGKATACEAECRPNGGLQWQLDYFCGLPQK
jgi:hypothetical protein